MNNPSALRWRKRAYGALFSLGLDSLSYAWGSASRSHSVFIIDGERLYMSSEAFPTLAEAPSTQPEEPEPALARLRPFSFLNIDFIDID